MVKKAVVMTEFENQMRIRAIELAAAAVASGHIHHYDVLILANEYLSFLLGLDHADEDQKGTQH